MRYYVYLSTKICLGILLLLLGTSAFSQVRWGFFAGPQAITARYLINDTVQDNSMKIGFQAGINMKVPLEGRLSFAPSIGYNLRGYKVKFNNISQLPDYHAIDNNTSFHTVELSFLLQHDFTTGAAHWFFRLGPSLDFALFGKEEFNTTSSTTVKRDMKFSFNDYGHYLAAANLHVGFETASGFFIYAQYHYGLTTMNNNDYGPQIGNRAGGLSIGKYFK